MELGAGPTKHEQGTREKGVFLKFQTRQLSNHGLTVERDTLTTHTLARHNSYKLIYILRHR